MNPDFSKTPRGELEVKLTALLLGELPEAEAAALQSALKQDTGLAALYERLKQTLVLVRESATERPVEAAATAPASLKLSEERRQKLLARFKTIAPKEFSSPPQRKISWLVPLAAAAVVLLVSAITIPNFSRARTTAQKNAIINNLRQIDGAKQQWALENKKSPDDVPTPEEIRPYLGRGQQGKMPEPLAGETYVLGKVGESTVAELDARAAKKELKGLGTSPIANAAPGQRVRLSMDGKLTLAPEPALASATPSSGAPVDRTTTSAAATPPAPFDSYTPRPLATIVLPGVDETAKPAYGATIVSGLQGESLADVPSQSTFGIAPGGAVTTAQNDKRSAGNAGTLTIAANDFQSRLSLESGTNRLRFPGSGTAAANEPLQTRSYRVDPNTLARGLESVSGSEFGGGGGGGGGIGGFNFVTSTSSLDAEQSQLKQFYKSLGVDLAADTGKSISFDDRTGEIVVRASKKDLDVIEAANGVLSTAPPPEVVVKARFVEVTNGDLGFDWFAGNPTAAGKKDLPALGVDAVGGAAVPGFELADSSVQQKLETPRAHANEESRAGNNMGKVPLLEDVPITGMLFRH